MKVIGLAGWSGAGKTTLLTRAIPHLLKEGLRVSVIKHAHHAFDVDVPGKDSWRHREAGASEVMVASAHRFALMREMRGEPEWTLGRLLAKLSPVDLVIVEGFKRDPYAKIEIWRAALGKPPLAPDDETVRAIATADRLSGATIPVVDLDDVEAVADAVLRYAEPVAGVIARSGRS